MTEMSTVVGREFMSVSEVAMQLGVSTPTVRRKIAAGELPAVRLGGPGSSLRVPREGLAAWLDGHLIEGEGS